MSTRFPSCAREPNPNPGGLLRSWSRTSTFRGEQLTQPIHRNPEPQPDQGKDRQGIHGQTPNAGPQDTSSTRLFRICSGSDIKDRCQREDNAKKCDEARYGKSDADYRLSSREHKGAKGNSSKPERRRDERNRSKHDAPHCSRKQTITSLHWASLFKVIGTLHILASINDSRMEPCQGKRLESATPISPPAERARSLPSQPSLHQSKPQHII